MTQSEHEIHCGEVVWELTQYKGEEISKERRARLEAHFLACSRCRILVDGMDTVLRLVGNGLSFVVPAGFSPRLRQRIAAIRGKH